VCSGERTYIIASSGLTPQYTKHTLRKNYDYWANEPEGGVLEKLLYLVI